VAKGRKRSKTGGTRRRKRAAKPRARTRRTAKRATRAKGRRPKARAAARRRRPVRPPSRARTAPQPAAPDGLRAEVIAALRRAGFDPPRPAVVDVTTAVGAGYREGPANAPVQLGSFVDRAIADAFVGFYATGAATGDIDRQPHRHIVRATVDMDLAQAGPADTTDEQRDVLAAICLGIWNPETDEHAKLNALAGFVVAWYRAGLA
jgi:hypothetical protein